MEDMGDLEMDLESMIGGGGGVSGGEKTSQPTAEVLSVMEQSSRALQQMGLILSKAIFLSDRNIQYPHSKIQDYKVFFLFLLIWWVLGCLVGFGNILFLWFSLSLD